MPPSQHHWNQFAVASTAAPAQHPPRTRRDPHHQGGIAVPRPPTSPSRPPRAAASLWAPSPPRVPGGPHLPGGSESLSNPRPAAVLPAVLPAAAHVCPHVPPTRSPLYFGVFRMCTASRHNPATPNPTARPSTCRGDIPVPRCSAWSWAGRWGDARGGRAALRSLRGAQTGGCWKSALGSKQLHQPLARAAGPSSCSRNASCSCL